MSGSQMYVHFTPVEVLIANAMPAKSRLAAAFVRPVTGNALHKKPVHLIIAASNRRGRRVRLALRGVTSGSY